MKQRSKELQKFIKADKARREVLATRAGFKTADAYRKHLEGYKLTYENYRKLPREERLKLANEAGYQTIAAYMSFLRSKNTIDVQTTKPVGKKTMYNIFILDESGSMRGDKYNSAYQGIIEEIGLLRKEKDVDIKLGIVGFSSSVNDLVIESLNSYSFNIPEFGLTALHDAVGQTLNSLINIISLDERAVVKIFTDGGENASYKYKANEVANLIKTAESKGITIVFVGTYHDVKITERMYNLRSGNTATHDNTAAGIKQAFRSMSASTVNYTKSYLAGASDEVLLDGFFKTTGKL